MKYSHLESDKLDAACAAAWLEFKQKFVPTHEEEQDFRAVFRWAFADGYKRGADRIVAVAKAALETN